MVGPFHRREYPTPWVGPVIPPNPVNSGWGIGAVTNIGDDDDLDGDWPPGIDGWPIQSGGCDGISAGGDGWGITNGEVPW